MPKPRRLKGGANASSQSNAPSPSSYGSASSYQLAVNGNTNAQLSRVNDDGSNSNTIVGVQGQKAGKRKSKGKGKRGGLWGEVINQAIVPFGLLAAQQTYKKKSGGKITRKSRGLKTRRGTRRR